jgi:hypothetical protein
MAYINFPGNTDKNAKHDEIQRRSVANRDEKYVKKMQHNNDWTSSPSFRLLNSVKCHPEFPQTLHRGRVAATLEHEE